MKYRKTCENCGKVVPSYRRDTFCSDMCTDDGYDMQRDYNMETYGNPKGYYDSRDYRWGSWDR